MSATGGLGPQWKPVPPLSKAGRNRADLFSAMRGGRRGDLGSQARVPIHQRLANTKPWRREQPVTNMGSLFEQLAPGQFDPAVLRNARRPLN